MAFGANAPIARPTNSTAPTPSENPPMIDLPDQITNADGEKDREDRLRADDIAGKMRAWHGLRLNVQQAGGSWQSAGVAAGGAKLTDHAGNQFRRRRWRCARARSQAPSPST